MAELDLLPSPEMYDAWEDWARAIRENLNLNLPNAGLSLPLRDSLGRTIIDVDGIFAYNAGGAVVVSPDIVQIDTEDLVNAAITTDKIANLAVDNDKLAALSVDAAKLANSAVTAVKIENLAVGTAAIALLAVGTAQIANAAILSAKIGDAQIIEAKILNLAVTNAKIFDLSVQKLTAGTIGAENIFLSSTRFHLDGVNELITIKDAQGTPVTRVKLGKLGAGTTDYGINIFDSSGSLIFGQATVGADFLNASQLWSAISGAGIPADNATVGATWSSNITSQPSNAALLNAQQTWAEVTGAGIPDDNADVTSVNTAAAISGQGALATLSTADWLTRVSGASKPANNADVTSANSQSPSWLTSAVVWSSNKITSGNVATYIANAAILNAQIGTLDAGKINTGTLLAARIGAGSIVASKIATNTLTATQIAANAIGTDELAANSITAAKGQIANLTVDTAQITNLAVETIKVAGGAITVGGTVFNSGNIGTGSSFVTIASITITPNLGKMLVSGGCTLVSSTGEPPAFVDGMRIRRGSTIILSSGANLTSINTSMSIASQDSSPGNSSVTYTLEASGDVISSGTATVASRWFTILNAKK